MGDSGIKRLPLFCPRSRAHGWQMAGLVFSKAADSLGAWLWKRLVHRRIGSQKSKHQLPWSGPKRYCFGARQAHCEAAFAEIGQPVDNVGLTAYNVEQICNILRPEDGVERICINFCNPWPRAKHNKRRLTHPRRLNDYKQFLKPGGELWFKTDDDGLFSDTLAYVKESGFALLSQTMDLHKSPDFFEQDAPTEHEKMFTEQGIPIKALIARWEPPVE